MKRVGLLAGIGTLLNVQFQAKHADRHKGLLQTPNKENQDEDTNNKEQHAAYHVIKILFVGRM